MARPLETGPSTIPSLISNPAWLMAKWVSVSAANPLGHKLLSSHLDLAVLVILFCFYGLKTISRLLHPSFGKAHGYLRNQPHEGSPGGIFLEEPFKISLGLFNYSWVIRSQRFLQGEFQGWRDFPTTTLVMGRKKHLSGSLRP